MKEMPTAVLPADSEYVYVPDQDNWIVQKKSGNKILSKKDYGEEAICPTCGEWRTTDFSPAELKEREWECSDCMNKRENASENRGQKEISQYDPEYEWLVKLVNTVVKAGVPAQEVKALSEAHPFVTIDDAGDLAAKIWTLATEKYNIPREWLIKKLPERRANLKKAYEGGYPTEEDSVQFGMAPAGWMANEPWKGDSKTGKREGESSPKNISEVVKYYIEHPHEEHGVVVDINTADRTLKFEDGFVISFDDVTNMIPKPDRGSDDQTVNDYSQNYFWGPNDLGRSHQNQPGANGWLPAGTEDMDGPSPNSRMSNFKSFMHKQSMLDKVAGMEKYWLAPDGQEYDLSFGREHVDWLRSNWDLLKEKYNIEVSENASKQPMWWDLYYKLIDEYGWSRVWREGYYGEFGIQVPNMKNIPSYVEKFLARHVEPSDKVYIGDDKDKTGKMVEITYWGYDLQQAVNEALQAERFVVNASVNKLSHCGPCSVIKAEVIKILADMKYKDGSAKAEDLEALATLSADPSNDPFIQYLGEVIEALPEEHEKEAQKLKNHKLALEDIQKRIDDKEMVVDKQEKVKKEAKKQELKLGLPSSDWFSVLINPTNNEAIGLLNRSKDHALRYAVDSEGTIYLWDAYEGVHEDVIKELHDYGYPLSFDDLEASRFFGTIQSEENLLATLKELGKRSLYSSLNKQANPPSRFWIAPNGKEFPVSGIHPVWINLNREMLTREYGITPKIYKNYSRVMGDMIKDGWVRISNEPAGTGFQIEVENIHSIPSYVDDFIAKYYKQGDTVAIGDGRKGTEITDPFPSIQKAVNKALKQPVTAALLDEVLDQTTQDAIAAEYGPSMLIAMRFYNDAVRYGQDPQRSMEYALEEVKRMHRPIEQRKFLEVLNTYFQG